MDTTITKGPCMLESLPVELLTLWRKNLYWAMAQKTTDRYRCTQDQVYPQVVQGVLDLAQREVGPQFCRLRRPKSPLCLPPRYTAPQEGLGGPVCTSHSTFQALEQRIPVQQ